MTQASLLLWGEEGEALDSASGGFDYTPPSGEAMARRRWPWFLVRAFRWQPGGVDGAWGRAVLFAGGGHGPLAAAAARLPIPRTATHRPGRAVIDLPGASERKVGVEIRGGNRGPQWLTTGLQRFYVATAQPKADALRWASGSSPSSPGSRQRG